MITAFSISSRTPSRPWCLDLGMGTASTWTAIVVMRLPSRSWMSMPNRVSTAWVYWPSSRRIPHPKSTPSLALNYHKLWQNREAVMSALGLPASLASSFPERTETVRNDLTAAGEGNKAHSEATRRGLDRMYGRILERIRALPAVSVA